MAHPDARLASRPPGIGEVEVAESTVRRYVRERKAAMGLLGRETFVPRSYAWGGEGQADWYESWAEFDGELHRSLEDRRPH